MMNIGSYSIQLLETCRFGLDGGAMFGVVPKALWQRSYAPGDERNRIPMAAKVMLLRSNDRTILIDTGNSPQMPQKLLDIYGITYEDYSLERSLDLVGVRPAEVTDVILTHLHFDHAGGAVGADGGPRFTNATYYVQREQLAWAHAPSEKDRASFMPEYYLPLVDAGVLELLDGPGEIMPGVSVEPLFGHTAAMQAVRVADGETTLFYPADLMPTSAHVPVPYVMGYDNHPLTTIAEKKRLLPQIIDEQWIVVFEHDAFRDAATIVMGDRGPILGTEYTLTV
jgi:glyoxylase-like metal-dependent hydrolase (beta-lactamase superfamily II)